MNSKNCKIWEATFWLWVLYITILKIYLELWKQSARFVFFVYRISVWGAVESKTWKNDKIKFIRTEVMAESLYFYGRQFVEQGWLWQKFGVILHDLTVLWFFKENKVMICWFQLQSLVSYVMALGIINNKSECIFKIKKTVRMVKFFCFLKFDLSSGREQNNKNQRNW